MKETRPCNGPCICGFSGSDVIMRNIFETIEMPHARNNAAGFEVQQYVMIDIGDFAQDDVAFPPL
jgi:hypothetical protein